MAPSNLGFGGGHNLLAGETDAPYLLILNPDVELTAPGTVERLLCLVASVLGWRSPGPKLLIGRRAAQPYDHGRLHGLAGGDRVQGRAQLLAGHRHRQEVAWVSGAAMLADRPAFMAHRRFRREAVPVQGGRGPLPRLREAGGRCLRARRGLSGIRGRWWPTAIGSRRGRQLLLRQALRGPALAAGVRRRAPDARLPALVTLALETVRRPVGELERAEQRATQCVLFLREEQRRIAELYDGGRRRRPHSRDLPR